jgi:glycosyltransferase involved in cell wall biosynthesis
MRISVLQPGARLHYIVPQIFARAGLLRTLYTDIHGDHALFRAAEAVIPLRMCPKPIRRLLGRRLPKDLPPCLVKDYPFRSLMSAATSALGLSTLATAMGPERTILRDVQNDNIGPEDVIYTVFINSDIHVVRALKSRGAKIIHECMISPDVGLWLREERALFPEVEEEDDDAEILRGRDLDKEKYRIADLILAPSDNTKKAIVDLGCDDRKVSVVPYGLDADSLTLGKPDPIPGRVLFVGSVGLRKGSHYFAAACRELEGRGLDFRAVGPFDSSVIGHPIFTGPTYLGQVPRPDVKEEFRRADVFALPTLSEGSPLAHLEALACGVPVITTPNCGSVVRDGIEGFIVPIRDPRALADRIEEVVSNRALRDRMSATARKRASQFTIGLYEKRLLSAIREAFRTHNRADKVEVASEVRSN